MSQNGGNEPDPPPQEGAAGQRMMTPTGQAWLSTFMEQQAMVQANTLFLTFMLGQAGVAMEIDKPAARKMIEQIREDIADLRESALSLADVCEDMLANAERNLAADAEPDE